MPYTNIVIVFHINVFVNCIFSLYDCICVLYMNVDSPMTGFWTNKIDLICDESIFQFRDVWLILLNVLLHEVLFFNKASSDPIA